MSTPGADERHTPRPCACTRLNVFAEPRRVCRSKRTCIFALCGSAPIWAEKRAKRSSGAEPVWQASRPARVGTVCAAAGAARARRKRMVQAVLRGTAPEEQHAGGEVSPPAHRPDTQVIWYSGPSPPSGVVSRPPLAVIAPHCTQFV